MGRREVAPQGELVNFKEPVTIEGFYLGSVRKAIPPNPEGNFYSVETLNNEVFSFFGTKILDEKMSKIDIGEYVTVVYEGKTATTKAGRTVKHFRVWVGQEDDDAARAGEETATATTEETTEDVPF